MEIFLYTALMHYPVTNKNGETIASAVTNLDLHDLARSAKTFGVRRCFIVTPLEDQQELVRKIIRHWTEGYGAKYNPKRREALEVICVAETLEQVKGMIARECGNSPKTIVTSAGRHQNALTYARCKQMLASGAPYLLMFGTAWGLSREFIEKADFFLDPIEGVGGYNHLSVRSASAIILDRLLGRII